jgi:hypothetical protein
VYTCASESVLAQSIPFSTPKFKSYKHKEIPRTLYKQLDDDLQSLQEKVSTYFIYIAILNCNLYLMKMYVKWSKYNS